MQWQLSAKCGGAEDQYQLDAGQKAFGATQCPECNIVYQLGNPEDENAHLNYHNSVRTLKFQVNYLISIILVLYIAIKKYDNISVTHILGMEERACYNGRSFYI